MCVESDRQMPGMIAAFRFCFAVHCVGTFPSCFELTEILKPQSFNCKGMNLSVTATLVAAIHKLGAQVIKPSVFSGNGEVRSSCEDPIYAARLIEDAKGDALLLDSVSDSRPAGTGRSIDWGLARRIRDKVRLPVILAGGLNAGNVGKAIEAVIPYGVDVISGVENQEERKKDPQKVRAFVKAVAEAPPFPCKSR